MQQVVEFERPDRKVLTVWRVSSLLTNGLWLLLGLLFLGGLVAFGKARLAVLLFLLVPLGSLAVTWITAELQYRAWGFCVGPTMLTMRHGWLWRQERTVPRDRIQHVDINTGPIDRRLGLSQVVIHTAGATVGMIPGLAHARAQELRDQLVPREPADDEEPAP